ncbi:MAG: hypothetical protein V5A62_07070 [Haloarculaceae archaeon]
MPTPTPIDSGTATEDDGSTRHGYETDGVVPTAEIEATEGDDE